jgi:inorganic pyrophosphatase
VCTSEPAAPGREIAVKPIALLRLRGQEGYEEIVVCVRAADSAWTGAESIHDIPGRLRSEIEEFATHRPPFVADVAVAGWMSREDAMTAVDDAAARWAATANGRG